ncbi:predicted protein [Histoplasma capsulatum G186AR]|uniref:Uncharacterized protein n=1 Tax=Ajellomyces capsulatus (strain G186AR / H82 / ATCC MYA-2454 / RMSCC 2432) TaxID=447093 RepID=C0P0N8_AJECG|nr:uncharacterized protein HCBG_08968 [Histoplasma capsulatum G186AR]EEH02858.1 predicted protein [Histoplasma capsulatum G186AR]
MQDEMLLVDFKNAQAWNEWVQTKEWQDFMQKTEKGGVFRCLHHEACTNSLRGLRGPIGAIMAVIDSFNSVQIWEESLFKISKVQKDILQDDESVWYGFKRRRDHTVRLLHTLHTAYFLTLKAGSQACPERNVATEQREREKEWEWSSLGNSSSGPVDPARHHPLPALGVRSTRPGLGARGLAMRGAWHFPPCGSVTTTDPGSSITALTICLAASKSAALLAY